MRIGIDIDDTITDSKTVVKKYIKKYAPYLEKMEYDDIHENTAEAFWNEYIEKIQSEVKFKDGVKEAFEYLKAIGYEIIIITARGHHLKYNPEEVTKKIFKEYEIPYDEIIYRSKPKGTDAKKMDIKLFIDDRDENLESVSNEGIECIKLVENYSNDKRFREFNNWHDLLLYIKIWGKEKYGN